MSKKNLYIPRQRAGQTENKVTLFPFLAVLLCTMGALIMLLVVIARNVREDNQAGQIIAPLPAETSKEKLRKLQDSIDEAKWFTENYEKTKQESAEKLADIKNKLGFAEKETQKILAEIERLVKLRQNIETAENVKDAELAQLEKLLKRRKQLLQQKELELAEQQKDAANNAVSYAIIPYKGQSGTFRRPIYVECKENIIIIQPEGIVLTKEDFLLADRPDNTFDTVIRAVRQYYIETQQIVRGSEPYPLLIVRPSGAAAYVAVQKALGKWVKDFGYELVDENWKVDYPAPSPDLKERMEKQLTVSRIRTQGILTAMKASGVMGEHEAMQFRLSPQGEVESINGQRIKEHREGFSSGENRGDKGWHVADSSPKIAQQKQVGQAQQTPIEQALAEQTQKGQNLTENPPNGETLKGQNMLSNGQCAEQLNRETQGKKQRSEWNDGKTAATEQPYSGQPALAGNGSSPPPKSPQFSTLAPPAKTLKTVSRIIKMQCDADKYILLPQNGLRNGQEISIGNNAAAAAEQLVKSINIMVSLWGIAGDEVAWRPILQIKVHAGGKQRFAELKQLLQHSGLVIEQN